MNQSALVIALLGCLLTGCSSSPTTHQVQASSFIQRQQVVRTTKQHYPAQNPQIVAMFPNNSKPSTPYKIIGKATVSKYNLIGKAREEATMHAMMKNLAASIGGDGLINVNNEDDAIQANVIKFQRILF